MAERDALAALAAADRERLEAVAVDLGHDRSRPLAALVRAWDSHVARLVAERDLDPDDGARWTPDDLVAALFMRDFVEAGLRGLPDDLAGLARSAVAAVDAAYRDFTVPDGDGLLRRWLPAEEHGGGWWWRRVPAAGPVARDLAELRRRLP